MFGELGVGQLYVKSPDLGVDLDDVTILQHARDLHDRTFRREITLQADDTAVAVSASRS